MCIFFLLLFLKMILLYLLLFYLFKTFMWGMQFLGFPSRDWIWAPYIGSMESRYWTRESQSCIFSHADAQHSGCESDVWDLRRQELNWRLFSSFLASPGEQACGIFLWWCFIILGVERQSQWQDGLHACSPYPWSEQKWTGCYFQLVKDDIHWLR